MGTDIQPQLKTFVLDANIISFWLKKAKGVRDKVDEMHNAGHTILISPHAWYEVQRGLLAADMTAVMRRFDNFCKSYKVAETDSLIHAIAAEVYAHRYKKGDTPNDMDIYIAAFCLQHGYTLVTNNTKHFENIPALILTDWAADAPPSS
jgi:predicted nucleic acid-binding protein